jgi:hypothetical protein
MLQKSGSAGGRRLQLISEGESESANPNMYVIESGKFEVIKDGRLVRY